MKQEEQEQNSAAGGLADRGGTWAVAAALGACFILGTLPTPLYPSYRQAFHFSEIMLTVIYAVYVLGTLTAMFFLGRLSDQLGRRPVVLISLGIAAAGAVVFLCAQSTAWLFPARILSGLAIALITGASAAWLIELRPRREKAAATEITIAANNIGLGLGSLIAGLLAQYAVLPLRLCYLVFLGLLTPLAALIWKAEETVEDRRRLAEVSLEPRIGVPRKLWRRFIPPAVAGLAMFSILGFYSALIPSLLEHALHDRNHATAGAIVAAVFFLGAAAVAVTPRLRSRAGFLSSLSLLVPGVILLVATDFLQSIWILLAGTVVTGIATGIGYRASLRMVNEMGPEERRSELVSSYLIVCYVGLSLPVVGVGVLSDLAGARIADSIFGGMIILLAAGAGFVEMKLAP